MKTIVFFFTCLSFFTIESLSQTYEIDASHSTIQIQVERFGVVDVTGRFKEVSGVIAYNSDDISQTKANAVIQVASYDANSKGGEEAVKGPAFLDAPNYPEITFQSIEMLVKDGENVLHGSLTIHGVTKEIYLPFVIKGPLLDLPTQKQSIAFNAYIEINRQDYGLSFDRKLPAGIPLVSNEVRITLNILALAK